MAILGIMAVLLAALLPIVIIIMIIVAIVRKNKEGKEGESFNSIIRTIYVYVLIICFLCLMIFGFLSFVNSVIDYYIPAETSISSSKNTLDTLLEENNRKNGILVNMYTYATMTVVSLPLFIYHSKLVKKQVKENKEIKNEKIK